MGAGDNPNVTTGSGGIPDTSQGHPYGRAVTESMGARTLSRALHGPEYGATDTSPFIGVLDVGQVI